MVRIFKDKRLHRRAGNAYRDARSWQAAAIAYRRHLADRPEDEAIWVQLGHVLKEAGSYGEAEAAYERAAALRPDDPDALLHLSHMLKGRGQTDAAAAAFSRLYALSPDPEVLEHLRRLQGARSTRPVVLARPGAFAYVIEDLIGCLQNQVTLSGIQRVQAGVILTALAEPARDAHFVIVNDAPDGDGWSHLRLRRDDLKRLLDYVGGPVVEREPLTRLLTIARLEAVPIRFGAGTTVVILGSFWGYNERPQHYLAAKRDGARLVLFIHDLIPLTHPQYCDANLVNTFWRMLAEFLPITDGFVTNSAYTKLQLDRLLAEETGRTVPVRVVPLAHGISDRPDAGTSWPAALARVRHRRYVAYVSTIEGRKNHLYVLRAWQRMMAAGVGVPDLVFVGRIGWRNEALAGLLAETSNLDGRVHVVHGLSDAELNAVYAGALFTTFTSVTEGWGLPVGESLVHGVPCVSSSAASMPEVGGEFVDYVDPEDLDDGVRVYTRMIEDGGYRAARARAIRQRFVPRSWHEVGRDLQDQLAALAAETLPARLEPVRFGPGDLFRPDGLFGRVRPATGYFRSPMGLALAGSFREAGPDGAWLRGDTGTISFRAEAPAESAVTLFVAVRPAAHAIGSRFALEIVDHRAAPRRWTVLTAGDNLLRIDGRVDEEGTCTLRLAIDRHRSASVQEEPAGGVALLALGYCLAQDREQRRALREHFLLAA